MWWRVTPPDSHNGSPFLVFVAAGRVAVSTKQGKYLMAPGDLWSEIRVDLEKVKFTCTMESVL